MQAFAKYLVLLIFLSCSVLSAGFQSMTENGKVNLTPEDEDELIFDNQSVEKVLNKGIRTSLNTVVTVKFINANLSDIIREIAVKSKINFIYDDRLLNIHGITIDAEDQPLDEVLDELLRKYNISYYEFEPGGIALAKQTRIDETTGGIKGTVKDEKGEKLFSVNVLVKELGLGNATDFNGNYVIRKIKPGEYTLEISCMGYEKIIRKIKISAGILIELNFTMKQTAFQIGGIEVIGTTELLPSDVGTKTIITGGEIEHFQASSVKDVLDLVPGVQKTNNPGLGKTTQVYLRGMETDNLSAVGTLVVIDGTPISNNANLQYEKASNSSLGTSNMMGGIDLRTIPADNINNIEVTTGLASVKYGDATSGVISIKSKTGIMPNRFKFKNNPDVREGNFEGGVDLAGGSLNYNFNAAQSERDVRLTGDEYLRLTGQLIYSKSLFENSLTTNSKILYQRVLDEEEPEGALQQTKNYNRGYTISLSTWGTYKPETDISSWDYNLFATMRRENSMKSRLVSGYVILPSGDTASTYIGRVETKGLEWTLGGRLEYNTVLYTGDLIHKLLFGIEPQYNANTGEGLIVDSLLNYYGLSSGRRSQSFNDIPGQLLLGTYFEDKITSHFIFDFNLMFGFRYEMYRPEKFNLSGLWGDGDLVKSHQGSFFNPRFNLMIYLSKNNQLRLSAGTSSKSPPMSMLYPEDDVIMWRNPVDGKNYYINPDRKQLDLKGYKETLYEISYDHKFANSVGVTLTGYFKSRTGNLNSYSIPVFQTAMVNGKTKVYYVDYYSLYSNLGITESKGLEFSIRTSKIKELNIDFTITGSYSFIKTPGVGVSYSSTPNASLGQYPNYKVPIAGIDTLIGWTYPRAGSWRDRLQINYSVRYTVPALGLWITLRAEQVVFENSQTLDQSPIDFNIAGASDIANYLFSQELKTKPNKWLLNFNMSKSLFKGAEVSFYVNNFLDEAAIRKYYSSPTVQSFEQRNPDLFYGLEFSMALDNLFK
ncbi:MAG: hypothetical protein FIA82_03630 [Melioribacter sp.]|nr:hypothetical protein [Melioribacter sp.]